MMNAAQLQNSSGVYEGALKRILGTVRDKLKRDFDMVFVVDGDEGSGKSVMGLQICKEVDPAFNIDRVVYTAKQLKEAVYKAEPGQAILYDEAYSGLGSRGTMGRTNRALVEMLTEIRYRNLFITIVQPSFFDLDKYAALHRSRALIHVYTDGANWDRGYYDFYNKDLKKLLYLKGKKLYNYKEVEPNFNGRFRNYYPLDVEAYKEKKRNSTAKEADDERLFILKTAKELRQAIATRVHNSDLGLTQQQISGVLEVSRITIYKYLKEMGINEDFEVST